MEPYSHLVLETTGERHHQLSFVESALIVAEPVKSHLYLRARQTKICDSNRGNRPLTVRGVTSTVEQTTDKTLRS